MSTSFGDFHDLESPGWIMNFAGGPKENFAVEGLGPSLIAACTVTFKRSKC